MSVWNFVDPARVHVEECSYLLTRELDTIVVVSCCYCRMYK